MSIKIDNVIVLTPFEKISKFVGSTAYILFGQPLTNAITTKVIVGIATPIIGGGAANALAPIAGPIIAYHALPNIVEASGGAGVAGAVGLIKIAEVCNRVISGTKQTQEDIELVDRKASDMKKRAFEEVSKELTETPVIIDNYCQ